MKKKLFLLMVITCAMVSPLKLALAQGTQPSKNSLAADPCTRAWAVAYNQISDEYNSALSSCFWGAVLNLIFPDPIDAFADANCVNVAYWNYSNALDAAAGQYEACLG